MAGRPEPLGLHQVILLDATVMALSTAFLGVMNGLGQFRRQALISACYSLARVAAPLAFFLAGYSLMGLIAGLVIADLVRLLVTAGLCKPEEQIPSRIAGHSLVLALS